MTPVKYPIRRKSSKNLSFDIVAFQSRSLKPICSHVAMIHQTEGVMARDSGARIASEDGRNPPFDNDGFAMVDAPMENGSDDDYDIAAPYAGDAADSPHGNTPPRRLDSMLSLPKKKSGIPGASFNLVNSIVGAGIIGMPYAFRQSGLITGIVLLALVGFLTGESGCAADVLRFAQRNIPWSLLAGPARTPHFYF